jgi:hypothetical protein
MKPHLILLATATFVLAALPTQSTALDFDCAKIVDTCTPIPSGLGNFTGFAYFAFDGGNVVFDGPGFSSLTQRT